MTAKLILVSAKVYPLLQVLNSMYSVSSCAILEDSKRLACSDE